MSGDSKRKLSVLLPEPDGELLRRQFKRYVFDKHGTEREMGRVLAEILRDFLKREGYWPPREEAGGGEHGEA